ncbi:MAG: YceI family protein [Bacteroidota bacterium]
MKTILFFGLGMIVSISTFAQGVYKATNTSVKFFSSAPMEDIEATNEKSVSLINTETKGMAFAVPINKFQFKKKLMQEHFNENYMESEKYPKGTFKGKINEDIDFSKDGTYEVSATGKLNIHGVEKDRTLKGTLIVKGNTLTLDAKMQVTLSEHDIEIPKVVFKKIAEVVDVTVHGEYSPKE